MTPEEAENYNGRVRWQFAKTIPRWPHEYTVRNWQPDLELEFEFAERNRRLGVVEPWSQESPSPRYHLAYFIVEDWEYWTMGEPIAETTVINRARVQPDVTQLR